MIARLGRSLAALLVTAGCVVHKPPHPPEFADRAPQAIRIYVVTSWSADGWQPEGAYRVSEFAAELEAAGFVVALAGHATEVPPGTAWIDGVIRHAGTNACENPFTVLTVFSLGVIPGYGCDGYGTRFDLHRSAGAAAQTIETGGYAPTISGWLAVPIGWPLGFRAGGVDARPRTSDDERIRALRAAVLEALAPR